MSRTPLYFTRYEPYGLDHVVLAERVVRWHSDESNGRRVTRILLDNGERITVAEDVDTVGRMVRSAGAA